MTLLRILCVALLATTAADAQQPATKKVAVIGYYDGNATKIDSFPIEKLTHLIFSFTHLRGNRLTVRNLRDTLIIQKLVSLKQRNPALKIILSMGGWGGCETCSAVFATRAGRREFAKSAREVNDYFHTDGVDLDWEYPAIAGYPGHQYLQEDKDNFTALVRKLRQKLGKHHEISFAAGGFTEYLRESIDWKKVAPKVDKINLMTYDLVNGNSALTGHHTPLYSTPKQIESVDNAVRYLDSAGVPLQKLIVGAAIYGRMFDVEADANNGLYQKGKFNHGISFSRLNKDTLQSQGFTAYWDDVAKAPYMYSPAKKQVLTYDDERSIMLKTKYVLDKHLGGIMFWQLSDDKFTDGLLDIIDRTLN